jgi:hypothetical protein
VIATTQGKELHAEATNNDAVQHSATVKATFYSASGGIVGTADGVVNQLRPGGTKTFSMHGIPDHARSRSRLTRSSSPSRKRGGELYAARRPIATVRRAAFAGRSDDRPIEPWPRSLARAQ